MIIVKTYNYKKTRTYKSNPLSLISINCSKLVWKIGTNGQTSVKELDSPEQAQEHASKQAAGKLKKGYQEIEYV